ncbi:MAG TPA: PepSY domain-containing protein [Saprospiraceae bacterium]|nr:PepSY domain-containing protein [Saprospiraceae bacterium]HMQ81502.1 PepSY domain-containing protein [Saprospiraceae bacterium]
MSKHWRLQKWTRKAHRYLGVFLGIQFLAWTLGGLYFSWTDISNIRGENKMADKQPLPIDAQTIRDDGWFEALQRLSPNASFAQIQIIDILGRAYYQIQLLSPEEKVILLDAQTLDLKPPLSEEEAISVAQASLKSPSKVLKVEYITHAHTHHEYREKPLPAYAVSFGKPNSTTVYVAAKLGTVQSFRSQQWRIFDFLWMLHTMDYNSRDNINNWLLRLFSLLGLITLSSGFLLFFLTSKFFQK